MAKFRQGVYTPRNPDKYVGDASKIRYMSSWELTFHRFLDGNPNILRWSSEGIKIPYIKPTDGRIHHYYPDYWIEYINQQGEIIQEIIEIKPEKQRNPGKRMSIYEQATYAINLAKWESCKAFCNQRGIIFRILTEKELFGGGK